MCSSTASYCKLDVAVLTPFVGTGCSWLRPLTAPLEVCFQVAGSVTEFTALVTAVAAAHYECALKQTGFQSSAMLVAT